MLSQHKHHLRELRTLGKGQKASILYRVTPFSVCVFCRVYRQKQGKWPRIALASKLRAKADNFLTDPVFTKLWFLSSTEIM